MNYFGENFLGRLSFICIILERIAHCPVSLNFLALDLFKEEVVRSALIGLLEFVSIEIKK